MSYFINEGSSFTKIRPHVKIDIFDFKNSNIIIEGLILKRKDYFLQLAHFQCLKMNPLMAEIIKKQFIETKFL